MSTSQLYQIFSKTLGTERFCFHAENKTDAEIKFVRWLGYHDFLDTATRSTFELIPVDSPQYQDNIHDEWVR